VIIAEPDNSTIQQFNNSTLIECVPNFSEGRDQGVIEKIEKSITSVPGVKVLHTDMGYDAHRTVITFAGPLAACVEAAFQSIVIATRLIDMSKHQGVHPRLGAVDVFPFVPLDIQSMTVAIECARLLASRVGNELNLPVYIYGEAAIHPTRRALADIRKGEYEGLSKKIIQTDWKPDFGPAVFNIKSGACIIGARKILAAYNINLKTKSVQTAQKIASRLREKNGGLKSVRAIGWWMPAFDCTQVSCNLVDLDETPLHLAFASCSALALEMGTEVTGSELVGLIPQQALTQATDFFYPNNNWPEQEKIKYAIGFLGLNAVKPFDPEKQIIEKVLLKRD